MVYLQIIVGIGCVVAAAAAAIYFMPSPMQQQQAYNSRRRRRSDDANDDNDYSKSQWNKSSETKRVPNSKHGDKCVLCLKVMTNETMHKMNCGHALHKSPCFEEYRDWRRECPYCEQHVIRLDEPGDVCSICCHTMEQDTMEYLRCEHALHKVCLKNLKANNIKSCPVCRRAL